MNENIQPNKISFFLIPILDYIISFSFGYALVYPLLGNSTFQIITSIVLMFLISKSSIPLAFLVFIDSSIRKRKSSHQREYLPMQTKLKLDQVQRKYMNSIFDNIVVNVKQQLLLHPTRYDALGVDCSVADRFILSLITNEVINEIESGNHHVYRGVLNIRGEELLDICYELIDLLVDVNEINLAEVTSIKSSLVKNLSLVG